MPKKSSAQLNRDIAESLGKAKPSHPQRARTLLPADWPDVGRRIVLDAARWYYQQVNEPFAVPDVLVDQAVEEVLKDLEREDRAGGERARQINDARSSWVSRYESGELDAEIKDAIQAWSRSVRRGALKM
jgi:hypothetical protein